MTYIKRPAIISIMLCFAIQNCPLVSASGKIWKQRIQHAWRVDEGEKLDVKIFETVDSEFELRFYRMEKLISVINSRNSYMGNYPESLYEIGDGNLVSLWTSGNGYNIVSIYNWDGKTIKQVLSEDSKLMPEILLDSKLANGFFVKSPSQVRYPALVISKVEWVRAKKDQGSELKPVTANLYWWNEKTNKYDCKKNVPWQLRMSNDAVPRR